MRRAIVQSSARSAIPARCLFATTQSLRGLEQTEKDIPESSTRRPTGLHSGPGQRLVSPREAKHWKYMKKMELIMKDEWDELEQFRSLPKPKKQFGNEAAEIVWPYAVLLENVIRVHPFTKSIYCYYGQKQMTALGKEATNVARRFARECMTPITFHNSQCYVETEMLLEYNETPWIAIHCMDGTHRLVPVNIAKLQEMGEEDVKTALLRKVLQEADEMGTAAKNTSHLYALLNERPNQNHYVRVDYQWMGVTPEERMQHTVQWIDDPSTVEPKIRNREFHTCNWLNNDSNLPLGKTFDASYRQWRSTNMGGHTKGGVHQFINGGWRASPMSNRAGVQPSLF